MEAGRRILDNFDLAALYCTFVGGIPVAINTFLSLGTLMKYWTSGDLVQPCPECGGSAYAYYLIGSFMSGARRGCFPLDRFLPYVHTSNFMSFRARMQRIAYIDRRLRYKKDYPSAGDLARDFADQTGDEFSARTFKRDIEWLRDQFAPIEYETRRRGYYYTHEDFQLPTIHLTEGDLLALMVADRALSSYRNSPFHERLRSVFERLTSLLPDKVSVSSQELATDLTVIAEPVTEIDGDVWSCLQECLERQLTAVVKYQTPQYDQPAVRLIDPYHIVGFRGEWYLLGWSHHDEEVRVYALGRIVECRLRRESFERPRDFDPNDYIDPNFGIFLNEPSGEVAIRFEPAVASKIRERWWHPGQEIEEHADGGIVLRYRTNQQSQTLFWVGQWGPNAEILDPPELRARASDWFTRAADHYR